MEDLTLAKFKQVASEYMNPAIEGHGEMIVKTINNLIKKRIEKGESAPDIQVVRDFAKVLRCLGDMDLNYIPRVMQNFNKVLGKNEIIAFILTVQSREIIEAGGIKGYDAVAEAVYRVADSDFAWGLIVDSTDILRKAGEDVKIDSDYILVEFIRNPSEAQTISQVIDMEKYGDRYRERVQRFY